MEEVLVFRGKKKPLKQLGIKEHMPATYSQMFQKTLESKNEKKKCSKIITFSECGEKVKGCYGLNFSPQNKYVGNPTL